MFMLDNDKRKSIWNPVIVFENLKKYQPTKIYGHDEKFIFYYESNHSLTYGKGCQPDTDVN